MPGAKKRNVDGSSEFYVFDARELPPSFLVAQKPIQVGAAA
jgi:hypothetical protein